MTNAVIIIVDAISYRHSWLTSKEHFPFLYSQKDKFLNFHKHFAVSNGTRNNLASILSGLPPSLHKTMNRKHSFRNNKYFNLQSILKKKNYNTFYYATQPLFHSERVGDKLDFTDATYLTPSMADFYIPALNFNKFVKKKHESIKDKAHFGIYHYTDVHAPFEPPKIRFKNTKEIYKFILKNILKIIKRFLWLKFKLPFSKKIKDIYKEYPSLKGNTDPMGPAISLERHPLNKEFYNKVWEEGSLHSDYMQMHCNASKYQDKGLEKIFDYFKKNSKDTIFFMLADHGNTDIVNPKIRKSDGILKEDLTHIPLSVLSFDESVSKKYNVVGDIDHLTSQTDIFYTILELLGDYKIDKKIDKLNFCRNLLNVKDSERYIFSEFNDERAPYGETRMFNLDEEIYLRIQSTDKIEDLIEYKSIINSIDFEKYKKYNDYKKSLNDNFKDIKNSINKI